MKYDKSILRSWFDLFVCGRWVEIRCVFVDGKNPRVMHERFNDVESIAAYLDAMPSRPHHVYWTMNELAEPRHNERGQVLAVEDKDISRRCWILIDFDPERPSGVSSTDAEKAHAKDVMDNVRSYLETKDWPDPVVVDSGNGYHLYYRVDAPNTEENTLIVEAFLKGLANRFSDDGVKLDTVVSNPSRVAKVPGTWAVKGPSTDDRPHRMSLIIEDPLIDDVVPMPRILEVAQDCGMTIDRHMDASTVQSGSKVIDPVDFMTDARVQRYVEKWEAEAIPLDDYGDYIAVAMSLSKGGPRYESYFHRICRFSDKYDEANAHAKFIDGLRHGRADESGAGIGKFFYLCEKYGIHDEDESMTASFPFDVFPSRVRDMVDHAHTSRLKMPKVYLSCGVLCAWSGAVGNLYSVELTRGHEENAVLYMALVGGKGKNKSHPLSLALHPIQVADDEAYKEYRTSMAKYKADQDMPKKERMGIPCPTRKRHIVGDITAEALATVMRDNPRGLMLYNDELIGWIKAQNQYRSGNGADAEMWLSLWSGKSHDVTRKTSEDVRISRPFVSVCGTIQPSVIPTLAENREANGFLDRILFAWPDDVKVEAMSMEDRDMDERDLEDWARALMSVVNLPMMDNPIKVRLSQGAERLYIDWQRAEAEKCNMLDRQRIRKTDDVPYNGIHAKMESYCLRFALILETMHHAFGADNGCKIIDEIGAESMEGSLRLCRYFTDQAMKVRGILYSSEVDLLAEDKKRLYLELPDSFSTSEGQAVADRLHVPERTYKRFINSRTYFRHVARGQYEKAFII